LCSIQADADVLAAYVFIVRTDRTINIALYFLDGLDGIDDLPVGAPVSIQVCSSGSIDLSSLESASSVTYMTRLHGRTVMKPAGFDMRNDNQVCSEIPVPCVFSVETTA
jgi:hypothetical protein